MGMSLSNYLKSKSLIKWYYILIFSLISVQVLGFQHRVDHFKANSQPQFLSVDPLQTSNLLALESKLQVFEKHNCLSWDSAALSFCFSFDHILFLNLSSHYLPREFLAFHLILANPFKLFHSRAPPQSIK